jgi:DtxR family Mn-dependent transcriptional regulator
VARNNNWRRRFRGGREHEKVDSVPTLYDKEDVDEMLELIYMVKESGGEITIDELRTKYEEGEDVDKLVREMVSVNLITVSDGVVAFSESGKKEAEKLIRSHRLAERLLTDVLLIEKDHELESQACAMEHILNPGVVDNICTILGHPTTCPHGLEIPPGSCCADRTRRAAPAVLGLDQLRSGESGRILYVETRNHARLDKLTAFGMLPGTIVRVHQRQPSLVVLVGETQLAIDREIAHNIHVVKTS